MSTIKLFKIFEILFEIVIKTMIKTNNGYLLIYSAKMLAKEFKIKMLKNKCCAKLKLIKNAYKH